RSQAVFDRAPVEAMVAAEPGVLARHRGADQSRVHWVRPELVAEEKYLSWTKDNLLRQVVYEGLREDKPPIDVRRLIPHSEPERRRAESQSGSRGAAAPPVACRACAAGGGGATNAQAPHGQCRYQRDQRRLAGRRDRSRQAAAPRAKGE